MGKQLAFYLNSSICTGCKACQIACKDKNNLPLGILWRRIVQYGGGSWQLHPTVKYLGVPNNIFAYSFSMSCNHCEDPACVRQCPAKAYSKRDRDGIVIHDPEKCIGCRYCTWACPFNAPQYDDSEGRVRKCNLCTDELDRGEAPACVASCPVRAIEIGLLDEIIERDGATLVITGVPWRGNTRPAVRYRVRREAIRD